MIPAISDKNKTFRKISLLAICLLILVLVGLFLMMQAQKEAQNNASSAKALTQEEKQKNAEHMAVITNAICNQFDEILGQYSDNLDNISYNSKPKETIYNNYKNIQKYSKETQHDAENIQIIDPRYEDIKTSLIQAEINIQLSAQHMMDHLNDPKNNADWKAQDELVNAMLLNKSVKERITTLTKEDGLKLAK